jgi:hypothetical protein
LSYLLKNSTHLERLAIMKTCPRDSSYISISLGH